MSALHMDAMEREISGRPLCPVQAQHSSRLHRTHCLRQGRLVLGAGLCSVQGLTRVIWTANQMAVAACAKCATDASSAAQADAGREQGLSGNHQVRGGGGKLS